MSFHSSPQGYLHLAPSVKCSVQMGQSISAELFPMLRKKHHLAFLYVSQSYQWLLFQHLGQQLFLSLGVNQRSLAISQSKAGTQTLHFSTPLALGGLVAKSTEGSYLAPFLLSFLPAQKGWQGVACQGRLPTTKISYTAVEIKNSWACLVPTTPFPWLCLALSRWSTLLCCLHMQGGTQGCRVQTLPPLMLFFFFVSFRWTDSAVSGVWRVSCCMAGACLRGILGFF